MSSTHADLSALEAAHGPGLYRARGITLVEGLGLRVRDVQGRAYLDCTASFGVACLGHAHPALVEVIAHQAGRLLSCSASFGNDQRALLLEELARVLPDLPRFFLCNSGTEANEAAIKFARLATGRTRIVAATGGFHGRTLGSLSATWERRYKEPFRPLVPGFCHVPYGDLEALEEGLDQDTAALILEVVQGEGGVRPAGAAFLRGAQELCRKCGALFILDEVQTGFGRTGRLFAREHAGLEPDMISLAKGIAGGVPMGALAMGPRVSGLAPGAHGSTFGGAPLACAAARCVLRIIKEERLVERAASTGKVLAEGLQALRSAHIKEVRGLGLMLGVELQAEVAPVVRALQEQGVLVLSAGPRVLRFLPALVMSADEAREAVDAVGRVLEAG